MSVEQKKTWRCTGNEHQSLKTENFKLWKQWKTRQNQVQIIRSSQPPIEPLLFYSLLGFPGNSWPCICRSISKLNNPVWWLSFWLDCTNRRRHTAATRLVSIFLCISPWYNAAPNLLSILTRFKSLTITLTPFHLRNILKTTLQLLGPNISRRTGFSCLGPLITHRKEQIWVDSRRKS